MFKWKKEKMACEQNREMISSLIDAELSPAEKKMLEKHLGGCVKCRSLEEWLRCVKEGISRSAEDLAVPSNLRDKILASLPEIPAEQSPVPWRRRLFVILLLLSLGVSPAFSWGPEGHEYINESAAVKAAVGKESFPPFFHSQDSIEVITYNGPEPDRWKKSPGYGRGKGHSLAHYINLDLIHDLSEARDHIIAIQIYQEKGLDSRVVGLLPYYIMETYEKLRVSFGEYREAVKRGSNTRPLEANILYYAGLLGHYVGDGSQPLHTTNHHHGWVGDNPKSYAMDKGIHQRFEVEFVRNIKAGDFVKMLMPPSRLADPFAEITAYLKRTHSSMEKVYELDKAGAFSQPTPESLQFLKERLAGASQMLLNLWYTAWLESDALESGATGHEPLTIDKQRQPALSRGGVF